MAKSAGAAFALIGHSERRAMGESDEAIRAAFAAAAGAGLVPILCVGELERQADGSHVAFVAAQLHSALRGTQSLAGKIAVAYEPVWAIGQAADAAMKPADVREMAIFIRKTLADILGRQSALRAPILYGGSVEPQNAAALIEEGDVSGLLVGHASADITSFLEILTACQK
jgi:triosephosphate isomerase